MTKPVPISPFRIIAGSGEIHCPKKGLIAIQRCTALQQETAAGGNACTCPTFENYTGGDPMADQPDLGSPVHQAGSPRAGVQRCTRCAKILIDNRGVMVLGGGPPRFWEVGDAIVEDGPAWSLARNFRGATLTCGKRELN